MEQSSSYPQRKAYKRKQKLLFNTLQKTANPDNYNLSIKIDRDGVNLERFVSGYKNKSVSRCPVYANYCRWIGFIRFAPKTYIKEEYKEFVCNHDDNILERYLADSEISPADYWIR